MDPVEQASSSMTAPVVLPADGAHRALQESRAEITEAFDGVKKKRRKR